MRRPSLHFVGAAALALLCILQLVALLRAPDAWMPSAIEVRLAPGDSISLGRDELAAPHAQSRHLAIGRDADGSWFVRAAEGAPPLTLVHGKTEQRTGSAVLTEGQRFAIGPARISVTSIADGAAVFSDGSSQWTFDGATLRRAGRALPACPDTPALARVVAGWNRIAPHALTVARPLSIGGNLHCGNRLGIPYVAPATALIARKDGALELAQTGISLTPILAGTSVLRPLAQKPQSLSGVDAMIVGRTRLALEQSNDSLTLRPSRYVALYPDPQTTLPEQLEWSWHKRGLWMVPAGSSWKLGAALLLAGAAAALFAFQQGRWPFVREVGHRDRIAAGAALLAAHAGFTALLLQRAGTPPGAGISFLIAGGALWCCLLLPGRLSLAWVAGILLLATGLSAQLELGLGAPDSSWLRHYQKTASLLSLGLGIGAFCYVRVRSSAARMRQAGLELLLALLALAALAALAMQVLFGDETGVFDLQPVEFAKLALTALTAHCLAVGLGWNNEGDTAQQWLRWLRMGAPVLLFAMLLAVALVQVDDFSPLILLLVWGAAIAFAFSLVARRHWASGAVVGVVLSVCCIIALLRAGGAPPAGWSFYGDRFLVWLEPLRHPHTGQQLLLGARAIAEGAWLGSDSLLGVASLGQGAGSALSIPAVQDDFAPSFFLNRHGLAGGLLLWVLQAGFIAGTVGTAVRAFAASRHTRDFRQAWFARFCCFTLCGGAAFVLGHFLLSWGTNLAIFPIMGQPMSFLSSGGSHLLFFICPLLAFGAISAQSFEEIESCRSTSNMKS